MRTRLLFLFFLFLHSSIIFAQDKNLVLKKFSPALQFNRVTNTQEKKSFVIVLSDPRSFKSFLADSLSITTYYEYAPARIFVVTLTWEQVYKKILSRPDVLFIDIQRTPHEEVAVSNLDLSANKVNLSRQRFPLYTGNGLAVSVKEHRPDTNDIDLKGRYQTTIYASNSLSSHATIMSTIIAGAGNSYYEGHGVADAANINSVNFTSLLPEPDAFYVQSNTSVQNHSYGTGIENFYGADAMAYDASVIARNYLMHVFSAGNSGTSASTTGTYSGIPGFANLTGSFKMAKNIITVGHTDSFNVVLPPSSKGPAYDGRVKPELVAFGEDGSSGAAAIVSGIAAIVQHAYKEVHGTIPNAALVKAILLNSADDVAQPGIDYNTGFGSVNAIKAMQGITTEKYFFGAVSEGATIYHSLSIPANIGKVKITMVWSDPPAAVNASKALVNDLDLELSLPSTAETWLPWVLSTYPHIDSLNKLPVRKKDSINNAEQITLDNPAAGNYVISVNGFAVPGFPAQPYFIAYQFDTANIFTWQYPAAQDNIFGGRVNTIRWSSTLPAAAGQLEYSIDNGANWQNINSSVDLTKGYFKWSAPDTFVTALLRIKEGASNYNSELFAISNRIATYVGFDCPDSFLFYWNKVKGVSSYQVYKLGSKYMEPLLITSDTAVILAKTTNASKYYSVSPILGSRIGVRSYGFDYSTQGTGCYIRSFLASVSGNTGVLYLELGTIYGVQRIFWEKLGTNGYTTVSSTAVTTPIYIYSDQNLRTGSHTYRVRVQLSNGQVIYSQPETIYYFGSTNFIVYPNPSRQDESIHILSNDAEPAFVQVFNSAGVLIYTKNITDLNNSLPAGKFSKGVYFIRIAGEQHHEVLKAIVQ